MTVPPAFEWGEQLPAIAAGRVTLRALVDEDVADLFEVFSDPEVMRYWSTAPMTASADAADYLRHIHEGFHGRQLFQWGVAENATRRIIGTATLYRLDSEHRRTELGFALARRSWGKGFAREVVNALLTFSFEQLDLHRVEADVDPRNRRSLRLLEALGFRREGYLRERYHVGGETQDTVLLGLLRREYGMPPAATSPLS